MAPLLTEGLGVSCEVCALDTDLLGTFSGEVERTLTPVEAAREKCRRAMVEADCTLAIASEGSFGPHPTVPLVPADDEVLVLMDREHGSEFMVREVSTATNFGSASVATEKELLRFAENVGFPSHGLILRPFADKSLDIVKGITNKNSLLKEHSKIICKHGVALVETDMRANYNPSRMAVIAGATQKLVDKLNRRCPSCDWPGFSVSDVKRGLPCGLCGLPTEGVSRAISCCEHCGHVAEVRFPDGKTVEDPTYCGYCNP